MSNQVDPLLFWLEQEPVNSDADIYLPADTPNDYGLSKYNYQLDKRRHMKRHRAIARLRAYELEMITNKRKSQPPDDSQIPIPPFAKLETIKGVDFLNGHVKEIIEILKLAKKRHMDDQILVQETVDSVSNIHFEERDHNHARLLQIQVKSNIMTAQLAKIFSEYHRTLRKWKSMKENSLGFGMTFIMRLEIRAVCRRQRQRHPRILQYKRLIPLHYRRGCPAETQEAFYRNSANLIKYK
ncbi:hypothetical protein [Parasitella parasitica]|uniref:Uncharacterized protein n=1 Tax=Parasitella parasitica TaxID=35722 RepID=A0A0B7N749_9FUNG|nr:hypothetical protein [Parasitella parasitica]